MCEDDFDFGFEEPAYVPPQPAQGLPMPQQGLTIRVTVCLPRPFSVPGCTGNCRPCPYAAVCGEVI